jgi:hypothetical protein
MSDRAFSKPETSTTGLWVGPLAALANQAVTYALEIWACSRDADTVLYVVNAFWLAVALAATLMAYLRWSRVGRGSDDDGATIPARNRFLALTGIAVSALSALVIVAQLIAVPIFGPCAQGF